MNTLKKIFAIAFMFSFLFISSIKVNAEEAKQNEPEEKEKFDTTAVYTGVGLVTVGSAGALVIAHNSKKEKDVPVKEINSGQTESEE